MTTLGFWFLEYFESVLWVALVALLIPWVDAFSGLARPDGAHRREGARLFDRVAFDSLIPASRAPPCSAPDLLFFALFLAAAARWNLASVDVRRPHSSLGLTL